MEIYPQMSHTFVLRLTCCFEKKNKADCVNVWKNVFLIIMKPGTDGSAYKCMFKDKYPNFEVGRSQMHSYGVSILTFVFLYK